MGDPKPCCERCSPARFTEVQECTTDRTVAAELCRRTALEDLSVIELIDKHGIQPPYTFAISCPRPYCVFRHQASFHNNEVPDIVVSMVQLGTCLCAELPVNDDSDLEAEADGFTITLLHLAAAVGNALVLQALAARGHVNCLILRHMTTPLQIAARHPENNIAEELVQILLDAGADVNYTVNNNFPLVGAIRSALERDHYSAFNLLLHHGAVMQSSCSEYLMTALVECNWKFAEMLLNADCQLQGLRVRNGSTLLHHLVAADCSDDLLQRILEQWEASDHEQWEIVDVSDHQRRTPLFFCLDHLERVKLLLSHNANPNHRDKSGFMPIMECMFHNTEVATLQCLLTAGADPNACSTNEGYTALHFAAWEGKLSLLQCLVEHGCPHDSPTKADRNTPLALAAHGNQLDTMAYLLSLGCNVNNADRDLDTPLLYCTFNGCPEGTKFLLDQGAHPDTESVHQATPLWNAIFRGSWQIVRLLLQENVRLDVASAGVRQHAQSDQAINIYTQKVTPMELAFKRGHPIILAVLAIASCYLSREQWLWKVGLEGLQPDLVHLHRWLCKLATQTPSLKALCRRRLRQLLGRPLQTRIAPLTIPVMLKSYLLFEELLPPKLNQVGCRSQFKDIEEWTELLEKLM